jgi:antitoxin MazE
VKVDLIRIGNSRGIRIPKPVIEQCGFGDTADLRIEEDRLIIAPDRKPRQDWEKAFRSAGSAAEDELLLDALPPNMFDREEWRW